MAKPKRKICFILTSKTHYGRSKHIIADLKKRKDVELQIIVGASAILKQHGNVDAWLKEDGFLSDARVTMTLEGGSNVAMAKTAGLGVIEFASLFENLNPDVVVVRGDRYEVLSAAMAAAYMNKTIAHIEGGDVTGTIDESVRHAITKLAHIHFATNKESKKRIIKMGERKKFVFNVGSPDVEFAASNAVAISGKDLSKIGVGARFDIDKEQFLLAMYHPVTSEADDNRKHTEELLAAVHELGMPTVWFWPNVDSGADEVTNAIRRFREHTDINSRTLFIKHLPPGKFIALLKKSSCLVGNSSAGIKECSYLGIPVVNIGTRQEGRMRAKNVMDVGYNAQKITRAIKKQLAVARYRPSRIYYKKNTSKKIVAVLALCDLYTQKKFYA